MKMRPLVLPLENGARLGSDEFMRRYESSPDSLKAELINGIVYMAPPVTEEHHGNPDNHLQGWLYSYAAHTEGVRAASNSTLKFADTSVPQPDALLMIEPPHGNTHRDAKGYLCGAPELVAEIAATTAAIDLGAKREAYRSARVQEYIVWCTVEESFFWFALEGDDYVPIKPDRRGVIHSRVFPGLCLDVKALLARKAAKVLDRLNTTLRSPEHKAFIAKLKRKPRASQR
jgi:Uma2 family endonuclease